MMSGYAVRHTQPVPNNTAPVSSGGLSYNRARGLVIIKKEACCALVSWGLKLGPRSTTVTCALRKIIHSLFTPDTKARQKIKSAIVPDVTDWPSNLVRLPNGPKGNRASRGVALLQTQRTVLPKRVLHVLAPRCHGPQEACHY